MNRGVAAAAAALAVLVLSGAQSCSLNRPVGGGGNSPGESSSGNPATLGPTVATQITSVTSPVAHGKKATLQATTTAGASCAITVTYTTGPSHASGLRMQTADSSGSVQWTWVVGARTKPGTFPIKVTCDPGGEATSQFTTT
jgi:micrococcal nuclease